MSDICIRTMNMATAISPVQGDRVWKQFIENIEERPTFTVVNNVERRIPDDILYKVVQLCYIAAVIYVHVTDMITQKNISEDDMYEDDTLIMLENKHEDTYDEIMKMMKARYGGIFGPVPFLVDKGVMYLPKDIIDLHEHEHLVINTENTVVESGDNK